MGATIMAILMTIVPQAKAQSCGLDADACHADFTPYTAVVMKRALHKRQRKSKLWPAQLHV